MRAKREKHFAGFADRLLEQVKVGLQQEQKEIQELKTRWRQQRQKQKQVQAALPCVVFHHHHPLQQGVLIANSCIHNSVRVTLS